VKGKWVVWRDGNTGEREFYEMDPIGKLVGGSTNFSIHHTEPAPIAPTVTEAAYPGPKDSLFAEPAEGFDLDPGLAFEFTQWEFYGPD
jgi:hypothetical protein